MVTIQQPTRPTPITNRLTVANKRGVMVSPHASILHENQMGIPSRFDTMIQLTPPASCRTHCGLQYRNKPPWIDRPTSVRHSGHRPSGEIPRRL